MSLRAFRTKTPGSILGALSVITVQYDPVTGDLLIEPGAFASRPGLRACRYSLSGLVEELDLVIPTRISSTGP